MRAAGRHEDIGSRHGGVVAAPGVVRVGEAALQHVCGEDVMTLTLGDILLVMGLVGVQGQVRVRVDVRMGVVDRLLGNVGRREVGRLEVGRRRGVT